MDPTLLSLPMLGMAAFFGFTAWADIGALNLEPITVPPFMEEHGYTPDMVTNRVVDHMHQVAVVAADNVRTFTRPTPVDVTPVQSHSNVLWYRDFLVTTQEFLHMAPPRVAVELTQDEELGHYLVRIRDRGEVTLIRGSLPTHDPEGLIRTVAEEIMVHFAPVDVAVARYAAEVSGRETEHISSRNLIALLLDQCAQGVRSPACLPQSQQELYMILGLGYLDAGDIAAAIDALQTANKVPGMHAEVTAFLGEAHRIKGNTQQAKDLFALAGRLDRFIGSRFHGYARQAETHGEPVEAGAMYEMAERLGAKTIDFYTDFGTFLLRSGDNERGASLLRQAVVASNNDAKVRALVQTLLTQSQN